MKLLGLDTSTETLGIVLMQDDRLLAKASYTGQRSHSRRLLPLLEKTLKTGGVKPSEIDLIACGRGPGSFTGLRVGHAFVKGLCAVDAIEVYPFSSLELLAYNVKKAHKRIAVVLDARREKFYYAQYERSSRGLRVVVKECLLSLDEVCVALKRSPEVALTGDALRRFEKPLAAALGGPGYLYPKRDWSIRAESLFHLLRSKKTLKPIPAGRLLPRYLRLSEPEEKRLGKK